MDQANTGGRIDFSIQSSSRFEVQNTECATSVDFNLNNNELLNVAQLNDLTPIGGKYSQTGGDVTIENTAAATSILNSGQGSLVFAANTLKTGDNYHIKIAGTIDTDGKNQELAFTINLGTTTIFEHGVFIISGVCHETFCLAV